MSIITFVFGFLFGAILQYSKLNRFNVISGLAIKKDFTVAKVMALAIGIGIIFLNIEIIRGLASYHIKPFLIGGVVLGGLIFGSGMAILGYCPGTLFISLGEGSLDALIGISGGLVGGIFYTLIAPYIKFILGPNLGAVSLNSLIGTGSLFIVLMLVIGFVLIVAAIAINRIEGSTDNKWIISGIGLAILNLFVFSNAITDRPIGASTTYPYLGDVLTGITKNDYFNKIQTAGNWELKFLSGALLAGLIISLIKKEFKFTLIHDNWKKYRGYSTKERIWWSFFGGFILILGARMAGGCTSGHIISGGMQLAFSSLTFAVFVFIGLLYTGKKFYKAEKK